MKNKEKGAFKSGNWLMALLSVIVIINTVLVITILFKRKSNIDRRAYVPNIFQKNQKEKSDFFDSLCPDIEMFDTHGQKIALSKFGGEVIIIRFTKFHLLDLPYLLFLEHLYKKYQEKGVHLFFIKLLGQNYSNATQEQFNYSVPIIEDDGFVSSIFNARLNEIVIIDRDFRMKFKDNQSPNRMIHDQLIRYLFEGTTMMPSISDEKLGLIMKEIYLRDVKSAKITNLGDLIKDRHAFVHLFISTCLSCPEHQRIALMKDVSSQINNKVQNIFLFGSGNNFNYIKKFAEKNELFDNFTVGIIQKSDNLSEKDYYQVFKLYLDPYLLIFKKGEIVFSEEIINQREINSEFLIKSIK